MYLNKIFLTIAVLSLAFAAAAQSYDADIARYRQHYKQEFVTEERSPLKAEDTGYLRFYTPDIRYKVLAKIELNDDTTGFTIPTSSGKLKKFRKYGTATFALAGKKQVLELYRNLQLAQDTAFGGQLFLPFKDRTNYSATYGGGRYLDFHIADIHDGWMTIDFNKCYNPYCAYSDGYNCPIPPDANKMDIEIKAGEKTFGRKRDH